MGIQVCDPHARQSGRQFARKRLGERAVGGLALWNPVDVDYLAAVAARFLYAFQEGRKVHGGMLLSNVCSIGLVIIPAGEMRH